MIFALFLTAVLGPVNIPEARAFHSGGVGTCKGCHNMHQGEVSSDRLLKGSDPSSTCLNCHAGAGGPASNSVFSSDGSALTPGGDFYWLTKTFTWSTGSSSGESHGHNVIAGDFNLSRDSQRNSAPGGTYPAADLACTSCHDPHGRIKGGTRKGSPPVSVSGSYGSQPAGGTNAGNYRLLGDADYIAPRDYDFSNKAPVAVQNFAEPYGESDSSHVDYGQGMSRWCTNCHSSYLNRDHSDSFSHRSGSTLQMSHVDHYNSYVKTGDLSGTRSTAYLQFVPFERGTGDPSQLDPTSTAGPDQNSRVMCLTCHRAHASAFRAAGRWDFDAELLADSHPAPDDGGVSGNDVSYSYYGRDIENEFGSGQKSFCEKCHQQ
ncbi:MAG: hypothetical protein ACLFV2_06610 [Desulfurivibrionaceae bacterium]